MTEPVNVDKDTLTTLLEQIAQAEARQSQLKTDIKATKQPAEPPKPQPSRQARKSQVLLQPAQPPPKLTALLAKIAQAEVRNAELTSAAEARKQAAGGGGGQAKSAKAVRVDEPRMLELRT